MSATNLQRRWLLRGGSATAQPIRPPWARKGFTDLCVRCDRCATACPERIVVRGDGGFPELDFGRGECTFCGACAGACPEPVFDRGQAVPWQARAIIADTCLTARDVVCRSCRDACPAGAVAFDLALGRVARARIEADRCTGCGACVAPCPVGAIRIVPEGAAA
jgi:ferredoxin-type protein NapF